MKKILIALVLLNGAPRLLHAQGILLNPDLLADYNATVNTRLYNIGNEQQNHHFEYKLPDEGTLRIDFLRLSDWGADNQLQFVTGIAAERAASLQDSFRSPTSTKTLSINVPINNEVLSVNYSEDLKDQNQMAYKNGAYYRLKTGYDTLRIVKNMSVRTKPMADSGLVQVQYTFILKNLADIQALARDPDLMPRLGRITDSVIAIKRRSWPRQDASAHNLTLSIDANRNDSLSFRNDRGGYAYGRHIGLSLSLGAIVYNNAVSPYAEIGIAYLFRTNSKMQFFTGLTMNGFGMLATGNGKTLSTTSGAYASYNIELGTCRQSVGFMANKTSLLFGIMTIKDEKPLFNMGVNVAVSRLASLGLNMAANFKNADKGGRYVYGVNFKFNF